MKKKKRIRSTKPIYVFMLIWIILAFIFPMHRLWGILFTTGISSFVAWMVSIDERRKAEGRDGQTQSNPKEAAPEKKSYGPEIDPILEEGQRAMGEMGRIYQSIKDPEVKEKINELMRITDKITQDAVSDPSDVPQIKKFMTYYLPTTIKLLNAYDRMSAQGIEGENLSRSMDNINEMLDSAIDAFRKRLDSLFADQALDIETEIDVMNTMLAREGLAGGKDFKVSSAGSAQTMELKQKGQ